MTRRRIFLAVSLVARLLGQTGCLFRTRLVEMRTSTAPLKTATKQELVDRINSEAAKIKTLNATVDIATSVGGEKKGKVTDFQEISGFVLVRKPDMLRMIGLFPLVRNKAFDMVSEGERFEALDSGNEQVLHWFQRSDQPIHQRLGEPAAANHLPRPAAAGNRCEERNCGAGEQHRSRSGCQKSKKLVEQPDYVLDIIRHSGNDWYLYRKIIFERVNLVPHRQTIYDKAGDVVTEATYQVYKDYNGVSFPNVIEINRPQEEYTIRLTVVKLVINETLSDEQFALQQPPGALVIDLDHPNQSAAAHGGAGCLPNQRQFREKISSSPVYGLEPMHCRLRISAWTCRAPSSSLCVSPRHEHRCGALWERLSCALRALPSCVLPCR